MKKYARICDTTNKGMNNGWYDEGGTEKQYFKKKKHVLKHIKAILKSDTEGGWENMSEDDMLEYAYNHYDIFWTEWEIEEGEPYYDKHGQEYIQCHKCKKDTIIQEHFNICQHCLTNL